MPIKFMNVEDAVKEIEAGRMLIVVDDEDRENEGDFIMAAEKARPEDVNFVATHGKGLLCQAITREAAERLRLDPMVACNTSAHTTAFAVSVDARDGTTTGISAFDRSVTIRTLADPDAEPEALLRPGHIFPLIAKDGGVLERDGHTEAAVDLARLAGLSPSGILCEIMDDDGTMARLPRLAELAERFGIGLVTVKSIAEYRRGLRAAERLAESALPTDRGDFRMILYANPERPDAPHFALLSERPFDPASALVRVHSECLTGETIGSRRCDCGAQLAEAQRRIAEEGGVLVYLRQEGRGIGLAEKIRAYALQDGGLDTLDANLALGHPADAREYSMAAAILKDLGVTGVRMLTNNPEKARELAERGIAVRERAAIEIEPNETNRYYLKTKRDRFGHLIRAV